MNINDLIRVEFILEAWMKPTINNQQTVLRSFRSEQSNVFTLELVYIWKLIMVMVLQIRKAFTLGVV